MSANEELEEHVHHAKDPFEKIVAGTMAIIAAVLAVVSVAGLHFSMEEILMQGRASDQWAYYQAKDIRRFTAEATRDTLTELKLGAAGIQTYDKAATKYRKDANDVQQEAREFEHERDRSGEKATRFHIGEVFLELAIVLSSLCILLKNNLLFYGGAVSALIGAGISVTAWLI